MSLFITSFLTHSTLTNYTYSLNCCSSTFHPELNSLPGRKGWNEMFGDIEPVCDSLSNEARLLHHRERLFTLKPQFGLSIQRAPVFLLKLQHVRRSNVTPFPVRNCSHESLLAVDGRCVLGWKKRNFRWVNSSRQKHSNSSGFKTQCLELETRGGQLFCRLTYRSSKAHISSQHIFTNVLDDLMAEKYRIFTLKGTLFATATANSSQDIYIFKKPSCKSSITI